MSEKVGKAFRQFMKKNQPMQVYAGKVTVVDEAKYTCDVEPVDGGPVYHDVRLKASIDNDDNGVVSIPEVNSYVLISTIGNDDNYKYVAVFGKIKKYLIKCFNGAKMEFQSDGKIRMHDGSNDGMVKVNPLVQKLNAIENKVNAHIAEYKVHVHADPISGSTGTTPSALTALANTQASQIKNDNVKH